MFAIRFLAAIAVIFSLVDACSNFIASPGATEDHSSLLAYNADSGMLYGTLYSYPRSTNQEGSKRIIHEWDTGKYLGEIKEVPSTYSVIGNMNEHGLTIGETTFGGLDLGEQEGAIMDYGSLIWVTLQRAKTAREAIHVLDGLMQEYGYYSEGESFSVADGIETWVMEIMGKGSHGKGSVWVAHKIPEGHVCAHANQARITQFKQNDPENTLFAKDVISFARDISLYEGSDEEFSFSDVYDPLTFTGARFCEARVWSLFGKVMGDDWMAQYEDYASGKNLTNRMPFTVKPPALISTHGLMEMMRDHYEGTSLDMSGEEFKDVGATDHIPYRAHPLTWKSGNRQYLNERPVATQQTGWGFIATTRSWMPDSLKGVLWFGPDDSSTTPHLPVYGSATRAPASYAGKGVQDGVISPMLKFDMANAFYAFNLVGNWVQTRWNDMYPDLHKAIIDAETKFQSALIEMDEKASTIHRTAGQTACVEAVTSWSANLGDSLVQQWNALFGELFVKFRDGYKIVPDPDDLSCGCSVGNAPYSESWYDAIVDSTGDHYLVPETGPEGNGDYSSSKPKKFHSRSKLDLLNRR